MAILPAMVKSGPLLEDFRRRPMMLRTSGSHEAGDRPGSLIARRDPAISLFFLS